MNYWLIGLGIVTLAAGIAVGWGIASVVQMMDDVDDIWAWDEEEEV